MSKKDQFQEYYHKYILKKYNQTVAKLAKRFENDNVLELDGKRVMIQRGPCGSFNCCFAKERVDKDSKKFIGKVCCAHFGCSKVLGKLHGTVHFINIDGGV